MVLLSRKRPPAPPVFVVVYGDEIFLRSRIKELLIRQVLDDAEPEHALTVVRGTDTTFSNLRNELESASFFSARRLIWVEDADEFISEHRSELEKLAEQLQKASSESEVDTSTANVLVLETKLFQSNTKLYKIVGDTGSITCKTPREQDLPKWCVEWANARYETKLNLEAAKMLILYVGTSLGMLDQELHKLADATTDGTVTPDLVEELVGKNKGGNVFHVLDHIGNGRGPQAIQIVQDLLAIGDVPLKILGALMVQIRKLARAALLIKKHGLGMDEALKQSGIPAYPAILENSKRQLRHLGWQRLETLLDLAVEIDMGLKGHNPLPENVQLEVFLVKLAKARIE
ncbi:MAG: DNA polymerase III subunit delta [Zavarzinella sp.]